jgi:hypothetical protein
MKDPGSQARDGVFFFSFTLIQIKPDLSEGGLPWLKKKDG